MNEPEILMLFPCLVYQAKLGQVDNQHLSNLAYGIKQRNAGETRNVWNCPTYNTLNQWHWRQGNDSEVNNLIEAVKQHVMTFVEQQGDIPPGIGFDDIDFWFNIAEPGDFQENHVHPGFHCSAVYYVHTPEQSGHIVFNSPDWNSRLPLPLEPGPREGFAMTNYSMPQPQAGQLLIFNSSLEHLVTQNLSKQDRISIAINFRLAYTNVSAY